MQAYLYLVRKQTSLLDLNKVRHTMITSKMKSLTKMTMILTITMTMMIGMMMMKNTFTSPSKNLFLMMLERPL